MLSKAIGAFGPISMAIAAAPPVGLAGPSAYTYKRMQKVKQQIENLRCSTESKSGKDEDQKIQRDPAWLAKK